jgi:Flp pilus assembly protein TadB
MIRFQYRDGMETRTIKLPGWAIGLAAVAVSLVGLTILILGAGLLLFVVPALIVAGLIARWRLNGLIRKAHRQSARYPDAIDGDYRVIDETNLGEGRRDPRR